MTDYILNTHGAPIDAVQTLIQHIWKTADLKAMVVPMNGIGPVIEDPVELASVNPFTPLMRNNSAATVLEALSTYPDAHIGALLRPCEMRALVSMAKLDGFPLENVLTISTDCLGTVPAGEYQWRTARKSESTEDLATESLNFARSGGLMGYRNRGACQACLEPGAEISDINIKIFGLPVRQVIMVSIESKSDVDISSFCDGTPNETQFKSHRKMLSKVTARHRHTLDRVLAGLNTSPNTPQELATMLDEYDAFEEVIEVCPICAVNRPQRDAKDHLQPEDIARWVISCAGCGMCEQAAPNSQSLTTVFAHVRTILEQDI